MSRALGLRPEAIDELNEAWNWYEDRRPGLGDELLGCVDGALARMQREPLAYPRVDGRVRQALVRRFPYVVLFVEYEDYVEILAVFNTSRDPVSWRRRLA